MSKTELIEYIKTTDCPMVAMRSCAQCSTPFRAFVRGGADVVAPMIGDLLHGHTLSVILPQEVRESMGERDAKTMYTRLLADAVQTVITSIQLRLTSTEELPQPTEWDDLDDLLANAHPDAPAYAVAAYTSAGTETMHCAHRSSMIGMIAEVVYQLALRSAAADKSAVREFTAQMMGIVRSHMDARYCRAMSMDRRKLQELTAEETLDDQPEGVG